MIMAVFRYDIFRIEVDYLLIPQIAYIKLEHQVPSGSLSNQRRKDELSWLMSTVGETKPEDGWKVQCEIQSLLFQTLFFLSEELGS